VVKWVDVWQKVGANEWFCSCMWRDDGRSTSPAMKLPVLSSACLHVLAAGLVWPIQAAVMYHQ